MSNSSSTVATVALSSALMYISNQTIDQSYEMTCKPIRDDYFQWLFIKRELLNSSYFQA